jgi:hypothetical protein
MYRALYDEVSWKREEEINFSMDASSFSERLKWYTVPFSIVQWPFYTSVLGTLVVFMIKRIWK